MSLAIATTSHPHGTLRLEAFSTQKVKLFLIQNCFFVRKCVLNAMGKIQKEGNRFYMNCLNWLFKIV